MLIAIKLSKLLKLYNCFCMIFEIVINFLLKRNVIEQAKTLVQSCKTNAFLIYIHKLFLCSTYGVVLYTPNCRIIVFAV